MPRHARAEAQDSFAGIWAGAGGRPDKLPPRTRHERRWPLWDCPTTSRRKAYGMGRVMSRELISWIAAVAVAALFVAIVLWLRTFALAPG
jgi:hypothetical protein